MVVKLQSKTSYDYGLLVFRVGIGAMFVAVHGLPKLMGGMTMWKGLGGAFSRIIGFAFVPAFWGFIASITEFGGGICLIVGVLFRPACALMLFTMMIAVVSIVRGGYGFNSASQPFELAVVLLALLWTGPGQLTLPRLFFTNHQPR